MTVGEREYGGLHDSGWEGVSGLHDSAYLLHVGGLCTSRGV